MEAQTEKNVFENDADDLYGIIHSTLLGESYFVTASKYRGDLDGLFRELSTAVNVLAERCILDGIGIEKCLSSSQLDPSIGFMCISKRCLFTAFERARLMEKNGELREKKKWLEIVRNLAFIEADNVDYFAGDDEMTENLKNFVSLA